MLGIAIAQLGRLICVGLAVSATAWFAQGFQPGDLPSLGVLAQTRGIEFGTAVATEPLRQEETYRELLGREFSMLVPEYEMKFASLHPARDRYDFAAADELVAFAGDRQMPLRGHALIWHRSLPGWLWPGAFAPEALADVMAAHIQTVVGRYRGRIPIWDVVNEAMADTGVGWRDTLWWQGMGPGYVETAFRLAHAADPEARLFYNDYGGEGLGGKSDAIYRLLQDLLARGVPVHGVGLQMHVDIAAPPDPEAVAGNLQRLGDLGLEVQVTEMDVSIKNGRGSLEERLIAQAAIYRQMLQVCLDAPNCTAFVVWGLSDRHSWLSDAPQWDSPLLFDWTYRPKPAYAALRDVLGAGSSEGSRDRDFPSAAGGNCRPREG